MKFFKLNTMRQAKPEYCVLRDFPEGMELLTFKLCHGVELEPGEYPADAKIFMSDEEKGSELPDLVGNTCNLLVVSRRLKEGIEKVNTAAAQYLPVSIYNHRKRLASADYFIINPLGTVDVLDTKESDIEYHEGKVVKVRKYVLDATKVQAAPDMFRVRENREAYVVSARVFEQWRVLIAEIS